MSRYVLHILLLVGMMLGLTSCIERGEVVSRSPDGKIVVYEGRKEGAGLAPDSVETYLLVAAKVPAADAQSIFEGQDVGRVCYDWSSPTMLNVRISGGYADRVVSHWSSPDGRRISIRYLGTTGCVWTKQSS